MVTLEYLGDIRVLVDVCLKVLFYYDPRAVCDTYRIAQWIDRKNNFEVVSYPTITSSFVIRY